jgi:NDP-sugar pyrophosphorylase family protein
MLLNIVIPMAGRGSRFAQAGYRDPKPLIPVGGKPMIQWVIENVRPARPHRFIFCVLAEHLERYAGVEKLLKTLAPGCVIVPVSQVTEGAACTVLLAREHIHNGDPLMTANSDQFVEMEIDTYLQHGDRTGHDGFIMTFGSDHPKWSYCRMGGGGLVAEVVEKQVVSREATVGIYNFARGADFVAAADRMIARNLRVNNEFYVAPCYNQMIEGGNKISVYNLGPEGSIMHGLGVPEDLEKFSRTESFHRRCLKA